MTNAATKSTPQDCTHGKKINSVLGVFHLFFYVLSDWLIGRSISRIINVSISLLINFNIGNSFILFHTKANTFQKIVPEITLFAVKWRKLVKTKRGRTRSNEYKKIFNPRNYIYILTRIPRENSRQSLREDTQRKNSNKFYSTISIPL